MNGHLVREAIRLNSRLVCPVDGATLDKQGTKDPNRWGHFHKELNEWHVTDVPKEETK